MPYKFEVSVEFEKYGEASSQQFEDITAPSTVAAIEAAESLVSEDMRPFIWQVTATNLSRVAGQ